MDLFSLDTAQIVPNMTLSYGELEIVHFVFGFPFGEVLADRKHGKIVIPSCDKFRYYLTPYRGLCPTPSQNRLGVGYGI